MLKLKLLYNQTLPGFQTHLKAFHKNEKDLNIFSKDKVKQTAENIHFEKHKNAYWLLYQVLRLEIDESEIIVEAIKSLNGILGQKGYA